MDLQHKIAISKTHKNEPRNMPQKYQDKNAVCEFERECLVKEVISIYHIVV